MSRIVSYLSRSIVLLLTITIEIKGRKIHLRKSYNELVEHQQVTLQDNDEHNINDSNNRNITTSSASKNTGKNSRILYQFNKDPKTVIQKDFVDTIGLISNGDGWKIWDRMSPIYDSSTTTMKDNNDAVQCEHKAIFRPAHKENTELPMCVHERDIVSNFIREKGRFSDCDELVHIWNKVVDRTTTTSDTKHLFLDIGANIGSCTMEMLASTNAYIIAFEPTPLNLAKLTSTLMLNDISLRNRVALFPIGLSDTAPGESIINSAKGNLGNSVIDVIIKDGEAQQFYEPVTIHLDTLDRIFHLSDTSKYDIPLIKMDVQGYECHVVNGGKNVFKNTEAFKTEFIEKWFLPHDCSEEKLRKVLHEDLGFDLIKGNFDVVGYKKKEAGY